MNFLDFIVEKGNMGAMMELIESSQIKRRRMLQFNLASDEVSLSLSLELLPAAEDLLLV